MWAKWACGWQQVQGNAVGMVWGGFCNIVMLTVNECSPAGQKRCLQNGIAGHSHCIKLKWRKMVCTAVTRTSVGNSCYANKHDNKLILSVLH